MKPENNKGDNGEKEYPANYRATYVALACLLYQTFRSGALRFHPSGALVLVGEGNASRGNPFALSFDNLLKGVATKGNVGAYSSPSCFPTFSINVEKATSYSGS